MSLIGCNDSNLAQVDLDASYQVVVDHLRETGKLKKELFGETE